MSDKKKQDLLAIQQPSTRALLTDDLTEAKEYFQSLPGIVLADLEAVKQSVEAKTIDKHSWINQRARGARLTEMYQDALRSHPNREAAIEAFMAEPGTQSLSLEDFKAALDELTRVKA